MEKITIQLTEEQLDDMKVALQCYEIDLLLRGEKEPWRERVYKIYQIVKNTQVNHEREKESRIARDRA